jgi:hypothetical protein
MKIDLELKRVCAKEPLQWKRDEKVVDLIATEGCKDCKKNAVYTQEAR